MGQDNRLFRSFQHAYRGLIYAISKEPNLQIELACALVVVATMMILHVKRWEAVVLLLSMFLVLILEMINTLIERLVNLFKPNMHPYAKVIKDMMAAVVLMAAFCSVLISILIFWPYLFG